MLYFNLNPSYKKNTPPDNIINYWAYIQKQHLQGIISKYYFKPTWIIEFLFFFYNVWTWNLEVILLHVDSEQTKAGDYIYQGSNENAKCSMRIQISVVAFLWLVTRWNQPKWNEVNKLTFLVIFLKTQTTG